MASYAYLFKYIIIGDTGMAERRAEVRSGRGEDGRRRKTRKSRCAHVSRALAALRVCNLCCVPSRPCGLSRRRQVVLAAAVHRQAVPARPRPHDWRRVWRAHGHHRRKADQAPDLGHGKGAATAPCHLPDPATDTARWRGMYLSPLRPAKSRSARSRGPTTAAPLALCSSTTLRGTSAFPRALPPSSAAADPARRVMQTCVQNLRLYVCTAARRSTT